MIDWLFPTTRPATSHEVIDEGAIRIALDALFSSTTEEEVRQLFLAHFSVLFSSFTSIVVCLTMIQALLSNENELAVELQEYLALVLRARRQPLATIRQQLLTKDWRQDAPETQIQDKREELLAIIELLSETFLYLSQPQDALLWAQLHLVRGQLYQELVQNEGEVFRAQALADFNAALTVFTQQDNPYQWATLRANRGLLTFESSRDEPHLLPFIVADFDAALRVFTRDEMPQDWALMHLHRGLVKTEMLSGERAARIEQAIADLHQALTVYTKETFPYEWALTCLNLGFALSQRQAGQRPDNMAQALHFLDASLEILTPQNSPRDWALAHNNRGFVLINSPTGERMENLVNAMREFDEALSIFTRGTTPFEWARTMMNRTLAYAQHAMESHHPEFLDTAINNYHAVLQVFTRTDMSYFWALTIMNRGCAYLYRSLGVEAENIEIAITDFAQALEVFTATDTPRDWLLTHLNRGIAYGKRIKGPRAENIEIAITNFNTVLAVITQEQMPYYWAMVCRNRAAAYFYRDFGDSDMNMRQVFSDIRSALQVMTRDVAPREYRDIQLMLAQVYEQQENWKEAASALKKAREVMNMLIEVASTEEGRGEVIGETSTASLHLREAQALLQSNPVEKDTATCVLEMGRTQNLRLALDLDTLHLEAEAASAKRIRFANLLAARSEWQAAQRLLAETALSSLSPTEHYTELARRRPLVKNAYTAFLHARNAIRQFDDPYFLLPNETLEDIGKALASPQSALIYLVANENDGFALLVTKQVNGATSTNFLPLPQLTRKAVLRILLGVDELPPVRHMQIIGGTAEVPFLSGGFWMAQLHMAFEFLTMWGETLDQARQALPQNSSYFEALSEWSHVRPGRLGAPPGNQRFEEMNIQERLALGVVFSNIVINIELKRSLRTLGLVAMDVVTEVLLQQQIHDVTLIPHGQLGLLPLTATSVLHPLQPQDSFYAFCDLFTVTTAPSARTKALALTRARLLDRKARPLLLTVGNPQPLAGNAASLRFAEAEADTIQQVARLYGYESGTLCRLRLRDATRERVIEALGRSWYAHLAVHGEYNIGVPRRSRLLLAGDASIAEEKRCIYLDEALSGTIQLQGMRLLTLSACETALFETSYAPDEVIGLASGFLQAGTAGVIASLWAVDDYATYLLMTRFNQLYLDPLQNLSPAQALAQAQHWLRDEATNMVLTSYNPTNTIPILNIPATTTVRSLRFTHTEALQAIQLQASLHSQQDPHALPYADPIYWAAFFVTGC